MDHSAHVECRDLNEAYFLTLQQCLLRGKMYELKCSSTQAKRLELDVLSGTIIHPGCRPLIPTFPQGMTPPFDNKYLENYLGYFLTTDKKHGEHYTYGQYIVPQIEKMIKYYKKHGQNKHCYISIGDAKSFDAYDEQGGTSPCLRGIDTKISEGSLSFNIIFRSWNLYNGFPLNLAALQLVKEYMSESIGCKDGQMHFSCLKAGIVESCIPSAEQFMGR